MIPPTVPLPGGLGSARTPYEAGLGRPSLAALLIRAAAVLGAASSLSAGAQTVNATVVTAPLPIAVAVNSVTNKIYVSSYIEKGQVTVIDGATNLTTAIPVGSYPYGIDVNMVTNKVYVACGGSNSVTVIDGATNATTSIPVGINPTAVSVNPVKNFIYVVNNNLDGTISVIDGATNAVTKNIFAGFNPTAVAVDTANDLIFAVAASNNKYSVGSPTVYLINVDTGDILEAEVGKKPVQMVVNPTSNKLYVANTGGNSDAVSIDVASKSEGGDVSLSGGGLAVAVNTVTNKAYFAGANAVDVADGNTDAVSVIPVGLNILGGIAVDPVTNLIYVTSVTNPGAVAAIDGATGQITFVQVGAFPSIVAVNPVTHRVYVLNNDAAGTVTVIDGIPSVAAPAITGVPQSQTVNSGSSVVFSVAASGDPIPTYQWSYNGVPLADGNGISGSTGAMLVLSGVTPAIAGSYTCAAANASGSATSSAANLAVISTSSPGRISNLSTRAYINSEFDSVGTSTLIAGFVISGTGSKSLVIRGVGPALANFGVPEFIENPSLALYDSAATANLITQDTGWQTAPSLPTTAPWLGAVAPVDAAPADFTHLGAFALPQGSADSAMKISLPPGAYTAQVSSTVSSAGIVLAELYDDDPGVPGTQLINISSRALTETGVEEMIAGFTISGSSAQTVLIRASGPALSALGITSVALGPQLRLYDAKGNLVASNQKWGGNPQIAATASRVGAFAWTDPKSGDSALLVTLSPGSYTAEVDSNGYGGEALVEVYSVP